MLRKRKNNNLVITNTILMAVTSQIQYEKEKNIFLENTPILKNDQKVNRPNLKLKPL